MSDVPKNDGVRTILPYQRRGRDPSGAKRGATFRQIVDTAAGTIVIAIVSVPLALLLAFFSARGRGGDPATAFYGTLGTVLLGLIVTSILLALSPSRRGPAIGIWIGLVACALLGICFAFLR